MNRAGSRAMGQPDSRGELEWQPRTADVWNKGGRLATARGARSVGY